MDAASHTAAGIFGLTGDPIFSNYMDTEEDIQPQYERDTVTGFING
jgi:hypothetical protein